MRLTILIPRNEPRYIEAIEITEKNVAIRKLPRSYDLNQLKEGWS